MIEQRFEVTYNDRILVGDTVPAGTQPTALMLHGAGKSLRTRYRPVQDRLASVGVASAVFDNVGHGDTGGELEASSLLDRTQQAEAVIKELKMEEPFDLIGGSMGAYTTIKLTEQHQINKLVLIVPGIYAADAYALPFNSGFSERIRQKGSWRESDAWEIISRFTGDLLVVTAQNDEVIPVEIPEKLLTSAMSARSRELYEIPTAPHRFTAYLNEPENAALLEGYMGRIEQFFQSEIPSPDKNAPIP